MTLGGEVETRRRKLPRQKWSEVQEDREEGEEISTGGKQQTQRGRDGKCQNPETQWSKQRHKA